MTGAPWRVVLDTDIGTDVDDLIALAILLGDPDVQLEAIITAYGDTELRAQIARRVCELAGRRDVPVAAGVGAPLSDVEVWWPGHEGAGMSGLSAEDVDDDGVGRLIDTVTAAPGEIDVLAIAPLTNVATAVLREPRFAGAVRHLWVMGGCFAPLPPDPDTGRFGEHNWACDPIAAWTVLHAGIPTTVCGLELTLQTRFRPHVAMRLAGAGPLGALLADQVARWHGATGRLDGDPAHDAVALLAARMPQLFAFVEATVDVVAVGPRRGLSYARPSAGSPIRIVASVDAAAVEETIESALAAACGSGAEPCL